MSSAIAAVLSVHPVVKDVQVLEGSPLSTSIPPWTIIGSAVAMALGVYASLLVFGCLDWQVRRKPCIKTVSILFLGSTTFTLGAWASQVLGMRLTLSSTTSDTFPLTFEPVSLVLSLLLPLLVVLATTLFQALVPRWPGWRSLLSLNFIGLTLAFMHYMLILQTPFVTVVNSPKSFAVIALSFCIPFAALIVYAGLQQSTANKVFLRLVVSLVMGSSVCAVQLFSLTTMSFFARSNLDDGELAGLSSYSNNLTIGISSGIGLTLVTLILSFSVVDLARKRSILPAGSNVVIASIAITSDDRLLTTTDGEIPHQLVNLTGLNKTALQEFQSSGGIFMWLYHLSYNWSVVDSITSRPIAGPVPHTASSLGSSSCKFPDIVSDGEVKAAGPHSFLKIRAFNAISRLAMDLGIEVQGLGRLHESASTTFLSIKGSTCHLSNLECGEKDDGPASVLVFVRRFRVPTNGEVGQGFRLTPISEVLPALKRDLGLPIRSAPSFLSSYRSLAQGMSKTGFPYGGIYVCLYSTLADGDGAQDKLLYDTTKRMVPSYHLFTHRLTPEMNAWRHDHVGCTITELLMKCEEDGSADLVEGSAQAANSSLLHFKVTLSLALKEMLEELHYIPNLENLGRLLPNVAVVSADDGNAAYILTVCAHLKHDNLAGPPYPYSLQHSHSGSINARPVAYTFANRSFFDIAHPYLHSSAVVCRSQMTSELEGLFPTRVPPRAQLNHGGGVPLSSVSRFSLDTVADSTESGFSARSRNTLSSLQSSLWSALSGHIPLVHRHISCKNITRTETIAPLFPVYTIGEESSRGQSMLSLGDPVTLRNALNISAVTLDDLPNASPVPRRPLPPVPALPSPVHLPHTLRGKGSEWSLATTLHSAEIGQAVTVRTVCSLEKAEPL